jgi:endonuclease/exonuclease/phosphatase (EEP) superfamily protein YafD
MRAGQVSNLPTWPVSARSEAVSTAPRPLPNPPPTQRRQRRASLGGRALAAAAKAPAALPAVAGLLGAGALVAAATGRRRLALAGAIGAVAATVPAQMTPRHRGRPAGPAGAPVRVVSFNVLWTNDDTDAIAAELERLDADVVALFEVTDRHLSELDAVLGPHRVECCPDGAASGAVLASWRPLAASEVHSNRAIRVEIETDGGSPLSVWAVHPTSMRDSVDGVKAWVYEHEHLREQLAADPSDVVVAVGDFNATPHHRLLRQTLRRGRLGLIRHPLAGGTWRHPTLGWLASLDHVAVRGPVTVTGSGVGAACGSDHRPVWADLAVHHA